MNPATRPFDCRDCGTDTGRFGVREYYHVHDEVWAAAGLRWDGGMLCIGCLELRLGRTLTPADFSHAPVNWSWTFGRMPHPSDRMIDRLLGNLVDNSSHS